MTRPLALIALCAGMIGCGADSCETLCNRTTTRLTTCLRGWSASWSDLGADDRAAFKSQCIEDWTATRARMESREVSLAEDACEEALDELNRMRECDELRVLYLE